MSTRRGILLAVIALTGTACASYPTVTPEQIDPRSEVVLTFAAPRDVTFFGAAGDSLTRAGVTGVRGRLIERRGDSLAIRATRTDYVGGDSQSLGTGTTVTVALADLGIQERDSHPGRSLVLVGGIILILAAVLSVATYEEPPPPPPKEEDVKVTETP